MTEVIIVGYPKSGNTWLTRLLSDALGWPVRGINEARPLSECGADHADGHVIRQLHLLPHTAGDDIAAIPHQYIFNTDAYDERYKIIHIIRDPRDVAVSIAHYWGIDDLMRVITEVMVTGSHPLWGCGWAQYVDTWKDAPVPVIEMRYEWLHDFPRYELRRLLSELGLRSAEPLGEIVKRQSLEVKRADLLENGEAMNLAHGLGAQLANLRGGRVGDWRVEFTEEHVLAFAELFTELLIEYGYEDDPAWHLTGVQTC